MPHPRSRSGVHLARPALTLLALAAVSAVAGCVGYTSAPQSYDESVFADPNAPMTHQVVAEAVRYVVRRYPLTGGDGRLRPWDPDAPAAAPGERPDFLINLPPGTRRSVYRLIVDTVGHGAGAPTPDNTGLGTNIPVFHVTRAYILGDEARVDVLRPALGFTGGAAEVYTPITVVLRGGLRPWSVVATQVHSLNSVPSPDINYIPPEDGPVPPTGWKPEEPAQPSSPVPALEPEPTPVEIPTERETPRTEPGSEPVRIDLPPEAVRPAPSQPPPAVPEPE